MPVHRDPFKKNGSSPASTLSIRFWMRDQALLCFRT